MDESEALRNGVGSAASAPERSTVRGIGRHAFWAYLQLGATTTASVVTASYVLRRLGPTDFGTFALIVTAASLLSSFDFGLSVTVMRASAREVVASGEERAQLRREVATGHVGYLILGAAIACVLIAVGTAVASTTGASRSAIVAIVIVGLSVGTSTATASLVGLLTGRQDFRRLAIVTAAGAASSVLVVLVLADALGIVALALGMLTGTAVARSALVAIVRRDVPWFSLRPFRPNRAELTRLASFTTPLLVLSLGAQIISATDVFVIGAMTGAGAVGLYRVGLLVPNHAIGILYRGIDTALPSLMADEDVERQDHALRFLTRITSFCAAAGFTSLAVVAGDVVRLVAGRPSDLAADVLVLFCCIWTVNAVVHMLALATISRGRQRRLVPVVVVEAVGNLVLTFVLVEQGGPRGAAIATLVTIVVSNLLIVPVRLRDEILGSPAMFVARYGLLPIALGVLAGGSAMATRLVPEWSSPATVASGLALGAVASVVVGGVAVGRDGREGLADLLRKAPGTSAPTVGIAP